MIMDDIILQFVNIDLICVEIILGSLSGAKNAETEDIKQEPYYWVRLEDVGVGGYDVVSLPARSVTK